MDAPEVKVKSIKKTIDVLNCFIERQPLGVTEISEKLGLYKSNVHNILTTLTAMNYLDQDKETGKYYLGLGALRLGHAIGDRYSFKNIAAHHMQKIADASREQVYFTVPFKENVYFMETSFPDEGTPVMVGNLRNPIETMHSTGCGKAMLAYMPQDYINEYVSKPLEAKTEYTITDPEDLMIELAETRVRGYAIDRMENVIGISSVAMPILSQKREVLGALGIIGPSPRFSDIRVKELVDILKEHIREIQSSI